MISELIARLKTWVKKTVEALKAQAAAAVEVFIPGKSVVDAVCALIAVQEKNLIQAGKWYRKTSGHAPIYSLYTFFGDRQ